MTWLRPQKAGIPVPQPSAMAGPFWEGLTRGELLFQRCTDCGAALHPPGMVCSRCASADLQWERSGGRGAVYSWTVVWRPQTPEFEVPYAPIVVDMDEGWQMLSALIDCDHESVRVGQRVQAVLHRLDGGFILPYFRPEGSSAH